MEAASDGANRRTVPGYDAWFLLLLAASALFRFLYSGWVQLTGDELMHWEWSRHLAAGYPEHPPMIAWSIFLSTWLLGTSERTVRLVSVAALTGTFWLAYRLGRELHGPRAAFLGTTTLMLAPVYNAGGVIATTDGLLSFFWTLTVLAVKKAVIDGRPVAWLAAGAATGLSLLTKLPALFLFPATALVLAGSREGRAWLRRWEPYAAAGVALLLFSPDLVWNGLHGWVTFTMRVGHAVPRSFTLRYLGELIAAQFFTVSPVLFPWLLWGLWRCWRRRSDPRALLLGAFTAVPFLTYVIYSVFAGADIHWPAIGYATGFLAAGAFTAEILDPRRARRFVAAAGVPAAVLLGVLYVVPLNPDLVEFSWSYSWKLKTDRLNEVVDWRQLGDPIGRLLAQGAGRSFVLCRQGYGLAGLASFYTPGRPDVLLWESSRRNGAAYDEWKAESDLRGASAVIVDDLSNPAFLDEVRRAFDTVSPPRDVELLRHGRVLRRFVLAYGTGFRGFPPEARQDSGS